MRRSPLQRKTPLKKGGPLKRSAFRRPTLAEAIAKQAAKIAKLREEGATRDAPKPRARIGKGKKVKEWDSERAELKKDFEAAGITSCEIALPGCWRDNGLGFAHTKKRRNVVDLRRVVLGCNVCHDYWEAKGEAKMEAALEAIIEKRGGVVGHLGKLIKDAGCTSDPAS